jgi:hypothetical protein
MHFKGAHFKGSGTVVCVLLYEWLHVCDIDFVEILDRVRTVRHRFWSESLKDQNFSDCEPKKFSGL